MKNSRLFKVLKYGQIFIFIVYLFLLLYLTIFKRLYYGTVTGILLENYRLSYDIYYRNSINLIPLKTVYIYLFHPPSENIALTNIYGNIIAFMPLGFLVPSIAKSCRSIRKVLFLSIGTSISIELIQLILRVGSTDIDDVILNTFGGLIGYLIFKLVLGLVHNKVGSKKYTQTNIDIN